MLKSLAVASALLCALLATTAEARPRVLHCIETGTIMIPQCNGQDFLAGVKSIKVEMHRVHRRHHSSHDTSSLDVGWTGNNLVAQARSFIGTNPTGWRRLWCGRFVAMIAPAAAARVRNPNMARAYLALPHTSGRVGDLAVMGRRGGGHVGIVSGFDASGNPIIISGNAGGSIVREGVYARPRILAFVSAT